MYLCASNYFEIGLNDLSFETLFLNILNFIIFISFCLTAKFIIYFFVFSELNFNLR